MKRALFIVVVVLIGVAFLAGFWPQHRRLVEAEERVQMLQQRLTEAEGRIHLGEVLGRLLRLSDAVAARNYGEAATLSSAYFNLVREEATRAERPEAKQALDQILQTRDQVTTGLARTDPSVSSTLEQQELALRKALGYPTADAIKG